MDAVAIVVLSILIFLFLFLAYYYSLSKKEKENHQIQLRSDSILWLIWTTPPIWQWVVSGTSLFRLAGLALLGALLLVWLLLFQKKERSMAIAEAKKALFLYVLGMISLSTGMLSYLFADPAKEYPTVQIISFFVLTVVVLEAITFVYKMYKQSKLEKPSARKSTEGKSTQGKSIKGKPIQGKSIKGKSTQEESSCEKSSAEKSSTEKSAANKKLHTSTSTSNQSPGEASELLAERPFQKRDMVALLVVMALWGAVALFRLGSTNMPDTARVVAPEEQDASGILLDLGTKQDIQVIQVHLGRLPLRIMTVYCVSEEDGEWFPANKDAELTYSFRWNPLWVLQNTQYIRILPQGDEAEIQEIYITNKQGEYILPINADEYPELFDEQDFYDENQTSYDQAMFDEIYYAGSALDFLQGRQMYEMTHPPMGKILIALGVWLFGANPFGWRIVCALFGLALLPLFYRLLYQMFRNTRIALLGTILLSLDFMHFTLSRIGTIDAIIAFFVLAVFTVLWDILALAKKELQSADRLSIKMRILICAEAILMGMAIATKWTGFYAAAGSAVIFVIFSCMMYKQFKRQKSVKRYLRGLILTGMSMFVLIPLGIYTLSFVPQTIVTGTGNPFTVMWENSLSMLFYHSTIEFMHSYSSPWYTWGWMQTPLLDDGTNFGDGWVSIIVTMGNPILWWSGLISFVHMLFRTVFQKDKRAGFLAAAYLAMYVPWFFVERTVFIYQYYCSSIFMIGMLSYSLALIGKKHPKRVAIFCIATLVCFLLFFPILSGMKVPAQYINVALKWLSTWKFFV